MEKTGKGKPLSERSDLSDLSHMLHGAGIFTHIWLVFFCVFFRPWEPNPTVGMTQALWRESWDDFDITSWLVKWLKWLHTSNNNLVEAQEVLRWTHFCGFTNQFPKNSTPTPPIRSYQAPKRLPKKSGGFFWGIQATHQLYVLPSFVIPELADKILDFGHTAIRDNWP